MPFECADEGGGDPIDNSNNSIVHGAGGKPDKEQYAFILESIAGESIVQNHQ